MIERREIKDIERTVRERLIEAGKQEFLEQGYEKASLRKICANAGVTTGALYFSFENKADLFESVVGDTINLLEKLAQEMMENEFEDLSVGVENEKRLLEFLWKNHEVFIILLEKAKATKYENFLETILQDLEITYEKFFIKYGQSKPDKALIHILVKMKMQGYLELIKGGYSLETTLQLAERVGWYAEGGFESLMKKLNQRM